MDRVSDFINESIQKAIDEKLNSIKSMNSEEEMRQALENIQDVTFDDEIDKILTDMSQNVIKDLKDNMFEYVSDFRLEEDDFLESHNQKWNKAIYSSEMFYIIVTDAIENYHNHVASLEEKIRKEKIYSYIALQHLQGRALQQYLEVTTLIKNGFADGAYARWRSMYELSITSYFIEKHGEETAKSFIESSNTEDRYEWARASNMFNHLKRHLRFGDIQRDIDFIDEKWRDQYVLANRVIHASPQGTFGRMANMKTENLIPIGRSDYGITTAAEHSAISLSQITISFLSLFTHGDSSVAAQYINDWVDVIRKNYFSIQDEIFPNEDIKEE